MKFCGRKRELSLLTRFASSRQAEMMILYGRRRIGKTRLLTKWIEQNKDLDSLYWVAEPSSPSEHLRSFSQALYRKVSPQFSVSPEFQYASWEQVWDVLLQVCAQRRLVLVWDEFTYMLQADPSIAGKLQHAWDQHLSHANLFFVITGSHLGMLHRHALSHQAPLYGRASAQLRLEPLPFGITKEYFPNYTADERVALYSIYGGVPAYWRRVDPEQSIADNIRSKLLSPGSLMHDEPRLLLQDFVSELHHYTSILRGIANHARTQKELSNATGLPGGHVAKYLSVLQEAGFIERQVSVTAAPTSRSGRYHLTDPYMRFYFRFLSRRQSLLAQGLQDQAFAEIKEHFRDFIGTYTWEFLCREWVNRAGPAGKLPFVPDQTGSLWNARLQIDVAAINTRDKTICLGECKWSPKKQKQKVISDLLEKLEVALPSKGKWEVLPVGFFRNGMHHAPSEANINLPNITKLHAPRVLTLREVDKDLIAWSE